jgi:hypothetical protein
MKAAASRADPKQAQIYPDIRESYKLYPLK